MAELFQNKYRIASLRKPDWNYGDDAAYFITICVHEMRQEFGFIENAALVPTPLGDIAGKHWMEIPDKFPYAMLDVHVIMPNHMHGILIIDKTMMPEMDGDGACVDGLVDNVVNTNDRTNRDTPQNPNPRGGITGEMNPMLQENLGRILRWYKGRCSFEMHKINPKFKWQARYWEHIIRDFESYERIRNYILNNPAKWEADRFFRK